MPPPGRTDPAAGPPVTGLPGRVGIRPLVALGDSMSCGAGVGVGVPLAGTWPALLAHQLGLAHRSLARPGAQVHDVLAEQVALAGPLRPRLLTVLIGANDVLRASDCAVGSALASVVAAFPDSTVLLLRLHDPTRLLPLPGPARRAVQRRVAQLNDAVQQTALDSGAALLDLAEVPALRRRDSWAVDRLHPSAVGHQVIAAAAGTLLTGRVGAPVGAGPCPGLLAELAWVGRHGLPYVAVHSRKMAPAGWAALSRRAAPAPRSAPPTLASAAPRPGRP